MKAIVVEHPLPACILNVADPARAHVPACQTDVRKTFEQHQHFYGDDYDDCERHAHLDFIGGFK